MARASLEIGNSNQELMGKGTKNKWTIWLTGILVFCVILVLIIVSVVLLTKNSDESSQYSPAKLITLEDVMSEKLSPSRFNATWISDDELFYFDYLGNFAVINVTSQQKTLITPWDAPGIRESFDHQLSPDKKYLLLAYGHKKIYRHTYLAQYKILNLKTRFITQVIPNNPVDLSLVAWGPVGNSLVYILNNNIYYKNSVSEKAIQLTTTGIDALFYNGVPDWIYEEEVFGSNKALWFSKDGSHLAFATFNDTPIRPMVIPYYGDPGNELFQYPKQLNVRYPKAGTENSIPGLNLVRFSNPVNTTVYPIPTKLKEPILSSVSFASNDTVAVTWTNRVQNESIVLLCSDQCKEIFKYDEPKGWIDMLRPMIFTADTKSFFTILPKTIEEDAWRQVARVTEKDSQDSLWIPEFLTSIKNTVTELLHWDEVDQKLWFVATSEKDSAFQNVYNVDLKGKIDCFTCNITHSSGSSCLYNEVAMSSDGSYLTVSCLGPQVPEIYIYSKGGKRLNIWEENVVVSDFVTNNNMPVVRRISVQVAGDNLPPAHVSLMTPANADLSGNTKYPLLINVYGGPDSCQVTERWNVGWETTLVSRWNITVANIDGRGCGKKGNNNLFAGYRNLGTVEINDQINVTRKLQTMLNYIDPKRTCIWGWSYGGYAAALSLLRGKDIFKCAISVAPVTDWLYYDSIYTERYMGLPSKDDNLSGYVAARINSVENINSLRNKSFMLVHGTLDDNVHFQQSMMLSRVLQKNDILFNQMSYTDEDHGLDGVKPHLYHTLEKFLEKNLLEKT